MQPPRAQSAVSRFLVRNISLDTLADVAEGLNRILAERGDPRRVTLATLVRNAPNSSLTGGLGTATLPIVAAVPSDGPVAARGSALSFAIVQSDECGAGATAENTVAVAVADDTMASAGLANGDVVIVRTDRVGRASPPSIGAVVLATVPGAGLQLWRVTADGFSALSDACPVPQVEAERAMVAGLAVGGLRRLQL
jgi:SOS-response transcriptional repressor LexA